MYTPTCVDITNFVNWIVWRVSNEIKLFHFHSAEETFDVATGDKLATAQMCAFIIGAGGFQGNRTSSNVIPLVPPPNRQPDASVTQQTSYDQVTRKYPLCV